MALTVGKVFDNLRLSYLADSAGNRFSNDVLRPLFEDTLSGLYATKPKAFYGRATLTDIENLMGMDDAAFLAVDLFTLISPDYRGQLYDRIVIRTGVTQQRGQQRGGALPAQNLQIDSPR